MISKTVSIQIKVLVILGSCRTGNCTKVTIVRLINDRTPHQNAIWRNKISKVFEPSIIKVTKDWHKLMSRNNVQVLNKLCYRLFSEAAKISNWFWLDGTLSQWENDWERLSQSQRGFEVSVWNPLWVGIFLNLNDNGILPESQYWVLPISHISIFRHFSLFFLFYHFGSLVSILLFFLKLIKSRIFVPIKTNVEFDKFFAVLNSSVMIGSQFS